MLLANEAVARAFNRSNLPAIHRVHDKPDPEKLAELRDTLAEMGVKVGDLNLQAEVAKFLNLTRDHPKGVYLKGLFLRAMKQACYKASPDGHFGLAKRDYTHFTSPIRRYADLIVQRIFDLYLFNKKYETAPSERPLSYDLPSLICIAEHISITEQNSTEAERQSVKNRQLEFFEREAQKSEKADFAATITDVKPHGIFVELDESMAYGLVPVSSMDGVWFYDAKDVVLRARQGGAKFGIGDKLQVVVLRVDRFKRQMDFALAGSSSESQRKALQKSFGKRPKEPRSSDKKRSNKKPQQSRRQAKPFGRRASKSSSRRHG